MTKPDMMMVPDLGMVHTIFQGQGQRVKGAREAGTRAHSKVPREARVSLLVIYIMTRKRVGHLHKDYVKSVIFSQALSGLAIGLVSCPDSNEGRKLANMRPHHDRQNHSDEDLVGSQIPITPNL